MKDFSDYDYLMDIITNGDIEKLEEASQIIDDFPNGKDHFFNRHWITNIIDCGTHKALEWALSKNINLNFCDEEGYTPLHSAIDRKKTGTCLFKH